MLSPVTTFDLDVDGVHLGCWLSVDDIWRLIPLQSNHYYRRLAHLFVGTEEDLSQSASLALLQWQSENAGEDRIRELVGLGLIHRAMIEEVKANRRLSVEDDELLLVVPNRRQLTEKQAELVTYARRVMYKLAGNPEWETLWLRLALKWDDEQIKQYWKRKKDDRKRMTPEKIDKLVATGVKRIKAGMDLSIVTDVQFIELVRYLAGEQ